ncbi:3-isopropylmalate dehydratase large subunit [Bienertia sinuspersici]
MPNPQLRDPEQKHLISKKPVDNSLVVQQASNKLSKCPKERLEDAPKNAKRRRGRRKTKGAIVEDLPVDGKLQLHVEPPIK